MKEGRKEGRKQPFPDQNECFSFQQSAALSCRFATFIDGAGKHSDAFYATSKYGEIKTTLKKKAEVSSPVTNNRMRIISVSIT